MSRQCDQRHGAEKPLSSATSWYATQLVSRYFSACSPPPAKPNYLEFRMYHVGSLPHSVCGPLCQQCPPASSLPGNFYSAFKAQLYHLQITWPWVQQILKECLLSACMSLYSLQLQSSDQDQLAKGLRRSPWDHEFLMTSKKVSKELTLFQVPQFKKFCKFILKHESHPRVMRAHWSPWLQESVPCLRSI